MIRKITYFLVLTILIGAITVLASPRDAEKEVLLVVKDRKIMAFSGLKSHWVEIDLKMNESVLSGKTAGNVAVAVTDIRLLGYSTLTDQWSVEDLMMHEVITKVQVEGNVATVETDKRVLGFSARFGEWIKPQTG
jgi:hypothetical protein